MLWVAVKMCKTQFVCFFGHYTSNILLLVPLSLSVPSSATHHTVQQMWAECCMCESQVLNCQVTLVILCKTLLDWLAACVCAWEQHDREESNLSSSFHPSFSISPPIVLVNHFIDTAILLMLFQPSTSLISCTNQSIVSPLTRLFIFFKRKYILDNCKHFEVYVGLDLKNCIKSFGSKSQASILKSIEHILLLTTSRIISELT